MTAVVLSLKQIGPRLVNKISTSVFSLFFSGSDQLPFAGFVHEASAVRALHGAGGVFVSL